MRRAWFRADPAGEDFFETAPLRLREVFEIPLGAERVWGDLTSENPLDWCRVLQRIDWTSARPFGIGTTRTVRVLGGLVVLRERFFRWEEGRRHSFFVEEARGIPFRRLAEDYLVEPTSERSCRFTWAIAMQPRIAGNIGNFGAGLVLRTVFRDTRKHYGLL